MMQLLWFYNGTLLWRGLWNFLSIVSFILRIWSPRKKVCVFSLPYMSTKFPKLIELYSVPVVHICSVSSLWFLSSNGLFCIVFCVHTISVNVAWNTKLSKKTKEIKNTNIKWKRNFVLYSPSSSFWQKSNFTELLQ